MSLPATHLDAAAVKHATEAHVDLDVVGMLEGSDKSSTVRFSWDYLRHYERYFAPLRHEPINLIEVGVQRAPSLRLWDWYFSRAQIVGIDIDPACARHAGGRVRIEIGSQADAGFLTRVCEAYPPSIFIDDGSHRAAHMIFTFEHVFPHVLPGGLYIVEDFEFHRAVSAARWQTETPRDAPGYFLDLIRQRLVREPVGSLPHRDILPHIDHIDVLGGALIIRRCPAGRDVKSAHQTAAAYVGLRVPDPAVQERLAAYLLHHKADPALALAAADHAIAIGGADTARLALRARALCAAGDLAGARATAAQASALPPRDADACSELARAYQQLGDWGGAVRAAETARALEPKLPRYRQRLNRIRKQAKEEGLLF